MQQENSSCLNREIRTKKPAEKRPAKSGFASLEAGLFFVSGEYSDLDEAGVPNCFHFSVLKS